MSVDLAAAVGPSIPHVFAREGVALWNREAPLFRMAMKERGVSNAVYWSVSNSGAGGSTGNLYVGEGEAVNTTNEFNVDDITALSLNRAIVRNGFSISHTELAQVESLRPEIAANILIERLKNSWINNLAATARFVEQEMLSGTGTSTSNSTSASCNSVVGLLQVFFGTSYAGKTIASYSGIQPQVKNMSTGSLTTSAIDKLIAAMQQAAGSFKPNFIMCNPKTAVQFKQLGDTYVRLNAQPGDQRLPWHLGLREVPTPDEPVVQYNGIPVVQNSGWSSTYDGYAVIGVMEDISIDFLPYSGWGDTISEENKAGVEGFGGLIDKVGLPFFTWPYAKTASTVSFMQEMEFQMKLKRPNRMGLLYNFST